MKKWLKYNKIIRHFQYISFAAIIIFSVTPIIIGGILEFFVDGYMDM